MEVLLKMEKEKEKNAFIIVVIQKNFAMVHLIMEYLLRDMSVILIRMENQMILLHIKKKKEKETKVKKLKLTDNKKLQIF